MNPEPEKIEIELPSGLYPFRLADLDRFEYGDYTLQNVFEQITEEQKQACVELWLRNRVIPSREAALERSKQVCYFITETASGDLIGVNTLYVDSVVPGGQQFFLNRMFIDPQSRNSRLMITGTAMMLMLAKTRLADRGMAGVVNVNENTKLARPGVNRIFKGLGYRKQGELRGQEVWYFEFDKVVIKEL